MFSYRSASLGLVMSIGVAACGGGGDGPHFQDDHPRIYLPGDRDRLAALVAADTPAWRRFRGMVDQQLGGADIYEFRAWYAALVGQLTGEPKYCKAAVAQIDAMVNGERDKIDGGDRPDVAFDSYLEVGGIVGDVALTYDWCFDAASDAQKTRWLAYADQAVWNVWHHDTASWGGTTMTWSGWATDDPSDNYYYSFLRATMLLGLAAHGEIDHGDQWLTTFRDDKIVGQLEPQFAHDLVGGGSREGTGYGVSMAGLFELYDLWHGSTGEQLADDTGHARASMLHMMHSTVPTLDRVAPIGDHARDSTAAWFDYHRNYLQILAYLFHDDPMAPRATWLLAHSSVPEMGQPFMYVYDFLYDSDLAPQSLDGAGRVYFAPGVGQLYARSSWDPDATWMSFIAGPYTESHAHQDQGSFLIYKHGWLAYDAVIDSHSGLPQEPEAHSVIRFVGGGATVAMKSPTESRMVAVARGLGWVHAAGDLTPAFGGGNSPVTRWQRELVYVEPGCIVVYDRADSTAATQQIWQLMSPSSPAIAGARATVTGGGHTLTVQRLLPAGATSSVHAMAGGDFSGGFRYEEASPGGTLRHLHVLSLDGAVTAVALDQTGGKDAAVITLSSGAIATVRFDPSAIGNGTLLISGGGAPDITATLGATVEDLPEME